MPPRSRLERCSPRSRKISRSVSTLAGSRRNSLVLSGSPSCPDHPTPLWSAQKILHATHSVRRDFTGARWCGGRRTGGRKRAPKAAQRGCRVGAPPPGRGGVSRDKRCSPSTPGSPPRGLCAVGWLEWAVSGQAPFVGWPHQRAPVKTLRASTKSATLSCYGVSGPLMTRSWFFQDRMEDFPRSQFVGFRGPRARTLGHA